MVAGDRDLVFESTCPPSKKSTESLVNPDSRKQAKGFPRGELVALGFGRSPIRRIEFKPCSFLGADEQVPMD
jgi:hypothetical protein